MPGPHSRALASLARPPHSRPARRLLGLALTSILLGAAAAPAHAASASALKKRIARAAQAGQVDQAMAAATELAGLGSRAAVDALVKVAAATSVDRLYRHIVLALAGLKEPSAVQGLARRIASGSEAERIVAAAACANRTDDKTLEALLDQADTRRAPVRRMVIRALVARRDKRAIPALLGTLQKLEGKPGSGAGLVIRALKELTGKSFGSWVEWQSFWDAKGNRFELPPPGEAQAALAKPTGSTQARFFGKTLDSDRIVFVIDVSGSMQVTDRKRESERPLTGGDGGGRHKPRSRARIDRAKAELLNAIEALPRTATFTIVAYSGMAPAGYRNGPDEPTEKTWLLRLSSRLLKATEQNVKKAVKFTEGLKARGSTFTGRATVEALSVKGAELIVLLSDGAPTEWEERGGSVHALSPRQVREKIRTANRNRRLAIDTFGFEGRGDGRAMVDPEAFVGFMKGVAKDNGGSYQAIE